MCSGRPLASFKTERIFCKACLNWPAKSFASHLPSPVQPTWPAMNTRVPLQAIPFEKPLARAQPGGCRIFIALTPCEGGREPKASGGFEFRKNQTPRSRKTRSLPPLTGGRQKIPDVSWIASQLEALQLAGLGAGQRVDEVDRARILVRRDAFLHVFLQLFSGLIVLGKVFFQNYESLHDRAAVGVRRAHHA